jgi:hypothetical protein
LASCAAPPPRPLPPTPAPDEIIARVTRILRRHTAGGIGLYLKQVDGPVLAALNENSTFEPASTIKLLYLLYALREEQDGHAQPAQSIPVYAKPASGSCPGPATGAREPLQDALKWMMRDSDNERTKAISETFGIEEVNAFALSIGLAHTYIHHTLGCGNDALRNPNQMTLVDAGRLLVGVADGEWLDAAHREMFFGLMAGKGEYAETQTEFLGIWEPALRFMIGEEAPSQVSARARESFHDRTDLAYKDGRYILCHGGGLCTEYRSLAGWAQIPYCEGTRMLTRQYVFGLYILDSTGATQADDAFEQTKAELLREQVRAGLDDWGGC